jgi:hypothetical protein
MRHRGRQVGWNVRALVSCPLPPMHDVGAEAATNTSLWVAGWSAPFRPFPTSSRRRNGRRLARELTERVIGLAIEVHRLTGPGMLESVYEGCLRHELEQAGVAFERQAGIPVTYKGV